MVLDSIWVAGEVLSIVALLCGAYLVLMETEPFLSLFGKRSAAPLLAKNLQLIEGLARYDPYSHSLAGDGVVDTQHQGLFDDANDLRAAILSGRPADEVGAIIDTFIRDAVQHFRDEEAILAAANYPGTAKHAALHRDLVNSAAMLVRRFRAGMLDIGELVQFMAHEVIAKHLLDEDQECIPYLESQR
ncbi:MAG: hemerythrin family protein [Betaproteobacteria bacterium]|nr:hemerythrin family protein [Betaproteobacteria bacterium]MDH3437340.1 hemerythrin family protein [Betaproteobacteria bacterium]